MPDDLIIRDCRDTDLACIRDIYNDAVLNTTAIWNEIPVDEENRRQWWQAKLALNHPVLVAERAGEVLGYAAWGQWRAFDGFRATMEHSVYVRSDRKRGGIGRRLMEALIAEARLREVHVLVACIEGGNAASIALHSRLGFREVGTFRQAGRKFDRWLDLTCMELPLEE